MPAREKTISEIRADDIRVNILGTVVDYSDNLIVLDDGTGKINATFEYKPPVRQGQLVRVMGRIMPLEEGVELQGEVCQDFSKIDRELWNKVSTMWEKFLSEI